ncbi:MAG: hypothetical protein M3R04_10715 [bacterium]|nr:hypothetical protein [bacterium]
MDNRSYEPGQEPKDPLLPDGSVIDHSSVIGEHHEQPVPVDPFSGIGGDPSAGHGMGETSGEAPRQSYPEYTGTAIDHQLPHASNQPTGAAPPYTSAHPAPSTYTPDAYAPGPGQPPLPPLSEDRKGINWLACCGITCGVLLVITIVVVFMGMKYIGPIYKSGLNLANVAEEVEKSGAPDTADVTVTAEELGANPSQFEGQWVAISGLVSDDPGASVDAMKQKRGLEDSSAYFIEPNIILLDVSTSMPSAHQGDIVLAIGKPVVFDFEKLLGPITGGQIEKDNELGDIKQMVFVITDSVTVVGSTDGTIPLEVETPGEEPPAP